MTNAPITLVNPQPAAVKIPGRFTLKTQPAGKTVLKVPGSNGSKTSGMVWMIRPGCYAVKGFLAPLSNGHITYTNKLFQAVQYARYTF